VIFCFQVCLHARLATATGTAQLSTQTKWAPGWNESTAAAPARIGAGGPIQGNNIKHEFLFFLKLFPS
jgi:hypothetical protein